jgi:hypothetical protein
MRSPNAERPAHWGVNGPHREDDLAGWLINSPNSNSHLITQLNCSRARLDKSVKLLNWALDLREQLYFGLDLDDAVAEVERLKRAATAIARKGGARR